MFFFMKLYITKRKESSMYSNAYVWSRVLSYMEKNHPTVAVTFFDDAEVVELTDRKLVIYSPSTFRKDTIINRYTDLIKEAMREQFQSDVELVVLDEDEFLKYTGEKKRNNFVEFNSQYTFDSFVVGSSNQHAYSAALAVAVFLAYRGKSLLTVSLAASAAVMLTEWMLLVCK